MRYDRGYGRDYRGAHEGGLAAGYPSVWAGAPYPGFGWGGFFWPPYAPLGYGVYDPEYIPRQRPEESPTYGRAGDEAVRRWARRHGYDAGYAVPPRNRGGRRWSGYDRYDQEYRRRPGR
jgi:hypothetical protein